MTQEGRSHQRESAGSVSLIERRLIAVEGTVQGVGFRPYVHSLATARHLHGFVRNDASGLTIEVQGHPVVLDDFFSILTTAPPPLATISRVTWRKVEVQGSDGFRIAPSESPDRPSEGASEHSTGAAPDVATCDDCLRELFNPADRRHGYPFLNCTQCGPRLTIINGLPYDRARTTMARFPMCEACSIEYNDPSNRRFHAQPIACADCGPALQVHRPESSDMVSVPNEDLIRDAAQVILDGGIVAIKGLGGYHLACDATSSPAVSRLRARKHRDAKPFAVMAASCENLRTFCEISGPEQALLTSRARPIVLLRKSSRGPRSLEDVSPRNPFVGAMLPYTPLHHLLLRAVDRALVMTSGNLADEPIAYEDDDANARLSAVADMILGHTRPIATRCDDSVMRIAGGSPAFIRRSRGFAPSPVTIPVPFPSHTIALGGQLKNTFCLGRDNLAFLSHHIGDLQNETAYRALEEGIEHYSELVRVRADTVAHDLHPGYLSTQIAQGLAGLKQVPIQHHHAHIASCMAENAVVEPVIGVAFDGAGLGTDGAIWGGEFLLVDAHGFRRVGHLGYVPLPGGDAAVKRPLRMALAHLWAAYDGDMPRARVPLLARTQPGEVRVLEQMLARRFNSPPTSSVGRLFDAVASLAGIRDDVAFEGQAATELEAIANGGSSRTYSMEISRAADCYIADPGSLIRMISDDVFRGVPASEISSAFHRSLAGMTRDIATRVRDESGVNRIALSGGVFQNALLEGLTAATLKEAGFEVYRQTLVPCNDGGLSLGQAYVVALGSMEV